MMELAVSDSIAATLRRSPRRRSIGIRVHRGQVLVSAPTSVPLPEINFFLQQKRQWIEKHLSQQQQAISERDEQQFEHGDTVFLLGQLVTLDTVTPTRSVQLVGDQLLVGRHRNEFAQRKKALELWYIEYAKQYLPDRVAHYQSVMGLQAGGLSVRRYKSRWGSCNRHGELQFNWLLMMAPTEVVDYVVVHELAHLRHFNHSPAFWQCVVRVKPDYPQLRQWLKNQTILYW